MEQFAHAYIIYSNTPEGRLRYARELIKEMLSASGQSVTPIISRRIDEGNYPDIMIISPVKGNISIDAVRSVKDFISLRPMEGAMKFVVITDCEQMRSEAQNAMLKILEETPENRAILLLGAGIESMLPTVLSRLRTVRLPDALDVEAGEETGEAEDMIRLVTQMLLEGDVDSLFELSGTIASADRITARDMLSQLYSVFHRLFIQLSGMAPLSPGAAGRLAQHMSAPLAMKICELIRQGMEDIKGNASMSIAAETMLISIREAYNAENSRN
ncbi:MAG: hypothetical protein J5822_09095 [Eubacteriaceae bacterium]|nr:hypothetical protein [Eubacteriaceae bacterium]